jgi:hypothetical protein
MPPSTTIPFLAHAAQHKTCEDDGCLEARPAVAGLNFQSISRVGAKSCPALGPENSLIWVKEFCPHLREYGHEVEWYWMRLATFNVDLDLDLDLESLDWPPKARLPLEVRAEVLRPARSPVR